MRTNQIAKQLDLILKRYRKAVAEEPNSPPASKRAELMASSAAAIDRYAPPNSAYLAYVSSVADYEEQYRLPCLMGVVEALHQDYKAGALTPIQELIRAEVFEDFLEMSEHLLDQGYKDPAAVVVGSVLEEHLRKLCDRAGIATTLPDGKPKKADALNSELAAKNVYGKLDQKSVTSWLGLRNDAAHGHYDRYVAEQVRLMLLGVRDFTHRTRP
jgi:hypothetical protein